MGGLVLPKKKIYNGGEILMINAEHIFEKLQNGEPLEKYETEYLMSIYEENMNHAHQMFSLLHNVDKELHKMECEVRYYKRKANKR